MLITIELSTDDVIFLQHDVLDIETWVQSAVAGKVGECRKRMAREAMERLKDDPTVEHMPASDVGLARALMAMPGYMNRAAREAKDVDCLSKP